MTTEEKIDLIICKELHRDLITSHRNQTNRIVTQGGDMYAHSETLELVEKITKVENRIKKLSNKFMEQL